MAALSVKRSIECFHSRGQHLCKFIETKESVCMRKEFNSLRTGLGHQHGRRFIVLGHQYGRRDVMWKHSILTPEKLDCESKDTRDSWFGPRSSRLRSVRSHGFVRQTKKVISRGHILFSLLASLLAHQNGQSFYKALECWNRKNFYRLTFHERKFLLFGWQRTLLCI